LYFPSTYKIKYLTDIEVGKNRRERRGIIISIAFYLAVVTPHAPDLPQ
jgi:hypothetical protein